MADEREGGTQPPSSDSDDNVNPDIQVDLPDGKSIKIDLDVPEWILLIISGIVLVCTGVVSL